MRILFVVHQFYPEFCSGTERVTLNLAKAAQRAGHHVQVLACVIDQSAVVARPSKYPGLLHSSYHGIPLTLVPRNRLPQKVDIGFDVSTHMVDSLAGWIGEEGFDLCHFMHTMRMGSALAAMRRLGVPYVMTLTDFFSECYRINLVDAAGAQCDGPHFGQRCGKVCLVSPWSADALQARHKQAHDILAGASCLVCPSDFVAERFRAAFPDLRFRVIPHGIDLLTIPMQAGLEGEDRPLTLGYVGSLIPQKGIDTLLLAMAEMPDAQVRLRICGAAVSEPAYGERIVQMARQDARVELLGQLSSAEVFGMMNALDVLCVPSRVPETFSLTLHEASAVGVPALVSDLGAQGAFIARNGCGRSLPAEDVAAWAQAIKELIADRSALEQWRHRLPLPLRCEEEGFFYQSLYAQSLAARKSA